MSDAKFHLVARASILASGDSDDFHHVSDDEVVMVEVEALEQARRERDEALAAQGANWYVVAQNLRSSVEDSKTRAEKAERELDEALKAQDKQLDDSERIIAALVKERDEARADAARLREVLEGGYELGDNGLVVNRNRASEALKGGG